MGLFSKIVKTVTHVATGVLNIGTFGLFGAAQSLLSGNGLPLPTWEKLFNTHTVNDVIKASAHYGIPIALTINEQPYDKTAFSQIVGFSTKEGIIDFFEKNPTYNTFDFCVDSANSKVNIKFKDTKYTDNSGTINFKLCYMGKDESCNCTQLDSITEIAMGFTTVDSNLAYPVDAHGMKYVGTKDRGLSTGGRCEKNLLTVNEQKLYQKYSKPYSVEYDDTLTTADLEQSRVLDLVYEYNGTAWVRKQNLIESIYYHTAVGDENNCLLFGGIHDTMAYYEYTYDNTINVISTPKFSEWDCGEKYGINIISQVTHGKKYTSSLDINTNSSCWETPTWQISGNFSPTCADISSSQCLLVSNPQYYSDSNNIMSFARDDFFKDKINIISFAETKNTKIKTSKTTTSAAQAKANAAVIKYISSWSKGT